MNGGVIITMMISFITKVVLVFFPFMKIGVITILKSKYRVLKHRVCFFIGSIQDKSRMAILPPSTTWYWVPWILQEVMSSVPKT